MATAWLYQKADDVRDLGDAAPHYCGWYEPDGRRKGKSFGPGPQGKKLAERFRRKVEAELMTGTYQLHTRKTWAEFRREFEARVLAGLASQTQAQATFALNHFQRLVKPVRVFALCTAHVDDYTAKRRQERGRRQGDVVSPATVNKELRHIKAALKVAVEWGYLARMPRFRMEREPKKLPTYVTGDHFAAVYRACDVATMPHGVPNVAPADWWRALLVMGYMTGWRIGDMLAFRRDALDLDAGTALSRAEDNKGKRDELVKLHPVVLDHLRRLATFGPLVFPWFHGGRTLYVQFARIQEAAGIHLPCRADHKHTALCHTYGFHDLRRAFATMNADKLTADALQALMRHKSYTTTQKYISLARQMDAAVASLHVPEVLKQASG